MTRLRNPLKHPTEKYRGKITVSQDGAQIDGQTLAVGAIGEAG